MDVSDGERLTTRALLGFEYIIAEVTKELSHSYYLDEFQSLLSEWGACRGVAYRLFISCPAWVSD